MQLFCVMINEMKYKTPWIQLLYETMEFYRSYNQMHGQKGTVSDKYYISRADKFFVKASVIPDH